MRENLFHSKNVLFMPPMRQPDFNSSDYRVRKKYKCIKINKVIPIFMYILFVVLTKGYKNVPVKTSLESSRPVKEDRTIK